MVPFVAEQDDVSGDTLCDQKQFSETRGHYWLWKNGKFAPDELVGINQYRRCFWFSQLIPKNHHLNDLNRRFDGGAPTIVTSRTDFIEYINIIEKADLSPLNEWLSGVDLVVNRDLRFGYPMSKLYGQNHRAADWDVLARILSKNGYDNGNFDWLTTHTVYIFTQELFDKYMTDWWNVMEEVNANIPVETDPYQHRKIGFMSEWFMTAWLIRLKIEHPALRIERLPIVEGQLKR